MTEKKMQRGLELRIPVMAGLDPAIHAIFCIGSSRKTWMPVTSTGMTTEETDSTHGLERAPSVEHRDQSFKNSPAL